VIVHGRRARAVRAVSAVAEANSADSGQAEGLTADLADGDLDSLVNNAGAFANRGPHRHYG